MFEKTAAAAEKSPPKRFEDMTYEERKKDREALVKRLWELREEAHREGMRFLTQDEFDEIWAEERAGGEGFNRVWNY